MIFFKNGFNKNGVENFCFYPTVSIKSYQIFVRLSLLIVYIAGEPEPEYP
jgi:hypothetical protein